MESPEIEEETNGGSAKGASFRFLRMENLLQQTANNIDQTARNTTDIAVMAGYLKSIDAKIKAGSRITELIICGHQVNN